MNKFIGVMVCMGFTILLTGCSGVFNVVKKDTVMVKEINVEREKDEVEYEGVLSVDTVETLSLNAVNKYFNEELTKGAVQFELMIIDQSNLKAMLDIVTLQSQQDPKIDASAELNKIPNGLFGITLTQTANPEDEYHIILNAQNGDVFKVSKWMGYLISAELQMYLHSEGLEANQEETIEVANQFIQEKGDYALSDLALIGSIRRGESIVEYYYMNKDNQTVSCSIVVNDETKQVMEFSKDLMAILNYFP